MILEEKFLGVYSLDKIPFILGDGGIIVNTQTSTLPGEHWLSIYNSNEVIKVFDPFGFYYPSILVNKLKTMRKRIEYNRIRYQKTLSITCGEHCLLWLYSQTL